VDHTALINSVSYMTVSSRMALTSSLSRIDSLLGMGTRASTDDGELIGLVEYLWETSAKNRSDRRWYVAARRAAGYPITDVTT
jgi:hypothetical protein